MKPSVKISIVVFCCCLIIMCSKPANTGSTVPDTVPVSDKERIEIISEKIDTAEFFDFWSKFKSDIFSNNQSLSINDTLIIAHPVFSCGRISKISKTKFIDKQYFSRLPLLNTLQQYDIDKDLKTHSKVMADGEERIINIYFSVYEESQQIVIKESVEVFFGYENNKTVFGFVKLNGEIKLWYIYRFAISIAE